MSSLKQIAANRRNALKSTGPVTLEGKQRSSRNAVRHGLTAETVIGSLEDLEDYQAFEAAVTADYEAQTALERELVLRLAGLLWRLRRATAIETALFEKICNSDMDIAGGFLRLAALPTFPLDRLSRYEYILWRQAQQTALTLHSLRRRQRSRAYHQGRQPLWRSAQAHGCDDGCL